MALSAAGGIRPVRLRRVVNDPTRDKSPGRQFVGNDKA